MKIRIELDVEQAEVPGITQMLETLRLLAAQIQGPGAPAAAPTVNVRPAVANGGAAAAAAPAPPAPPPAPPKDPTPSERSALAAQASALVARAAARQLAGPAYTAEADNLLRGRPMPSAAHAFADGWASAVLGRDPATGALAATPPPLAAPVGSTVAPLANLGNPPFDDVRAALAARVLNPIAESPANGDGGVSAATRARLGEAFGALVASRLLQAAGTVRTMAKLLGNRRKRAGAVALVRGLLTSPEATGPGGALRESGDTTDALRELGQAVEGKAAPAVLREPNGAALMADLRAIAAGLAGLGVKVDLPPPETPAAPPPPAAPPATAAPGPARAAPSPPPPPAAAAAAAAASRPLTAVTSVASLPQGHEETVFSLAVDDGDAGGTGTVASGGKDGIVTLWDGKGMAALAATVAAGGGAEAAATAAPPPLHRFKMDGMFAISVDAHSARRVLLAAWNGDEDHHNVTGVVTVTGITPGAGYGTVATVGCSETITCVRAFPQTDGFATGEDLADPRGPAGTPARPTVAVYDLSRPNHGPVSLYQGHSDLVSCLAAIPGEPKMMASGGGDGCVRLWDCRLPPERACVASFASADGGRAHAELVSGLDASGPLLASCSMDSTLCVWDVRGAVAAGGGSARPRPPLTKQNVDGTDMLKVALRPGSGSGGASRPAAAVITMRSAYVLDLSGAVMVAPGGAGASARPPATAPGAPPPVSVVPIQLFPDVAEAVAIDKAGPYQDVRWLPGAAALVCAGNTGRLDVMAAC